jgi:DNA-binding beta-propeller fold protein YncE
MERLRCSGYGLCLVLAGALLAACSGSATPGSSGIVPAGTNASVPEPASSALLYVTDTVTSDVYVFSYPKGKLKQTLTGFTDPAGECADAAGNVFITNTGANNIVEYAHGGTTPIAKLKDPGFFPVGCSIDPVTGNLAVTNFSTNSSTQGNVVIYRHAKGRPRGNYTDAKMSQMLLCGYDAEGNLFVSGQSASYVPAFAELSAGGKRLVDLTLDQAIGSAGGVQWDGKYVAIGDQSTNTIYQFSFNGTQGKKMGSTPLGGATEVFQFWIDGKRVVGPDTYGSDVGVWSYPAGGSPLKTIGGLYVPLGTVISRAK